jgi:hypothetical protein
LGNLCTILPFVVLVETFIVAKMLVVCLKCVYLCIALPSTNNSWIVEVVLLDTFTGTATRVVHCGSLLEELRSLLLQLWMKQDEHDDFMWFRLSKRNTLYPQDELYYYACSLS